MLPQLRGSPGVVEVARQVVRFENQDGGDSAMGLLSPSKFRVKDTAPPSPFAPELGVPQASLLFRLDSEKRPFFQNRAFLEKEEALLCGHQGLPAVGWCF